MDSDVPEGLRCTGTGGPGLRCIGGPHLRTYAPQWALKSCASVGRWAGGLSSGECAAGTGMAVAGAGPRPDLPLQLAMGSAYARPIAVPAPLALSAAVSQHVHGHHHHHKPETARGAPVVCRLSRLEIWPSPRPESRRQWESRSRGQGRMPQGSRGDVPPQARSHVHCDVFG